jgi:signal transduction histidine kinase/CheY-like chemotaxis protein
VIELASLKKFTASHKAFLEQLTDIVGIVVNNIEATMRTERLLAQSQQLTAEQQSQQLKLQQTNEELAQKAQLLAAQNAEVERKNKEIEQARRAVEENAAKLALTSRYKSEFLANMSHELRTPLNSILVLGQQLADNAEANLSSRQVEYATTIHAAGRDLLNLVNDILDLSKIESGTVTVDCEDLQFTTLEGAIERNFRHEAETRGLSFSTTLDPSLGPTMHTDVTRLLQILKNLLSNAFKFTERGSVELSVQEAFDGWTLGHPILDKARKVIAFSVSDTGMGIPLDKQRIIFEAFQQADAGTARMHGGTGLGLAISRELAHLLGGELQLQSEPGAGSTFTLYLPAEYAGATAFTKRQSSTDSDLQGYHSILLRPAESQGEMLDDRNSLAAGDEMLLIIESEPDYARVLLEVVHELGCKGLVASCGAEGLELARKHRPCAISLDISLADMVGWAVLSQLKQDERTRHIPVQILTADDERQHALAFHAYSQLRKPGAQEEIKRRIDSMRNFSRRDRRELLIAENSASNQGRLAGLTGGRDIEMTLVQSGQECLRALDDRSFDCCVIDMDLADMSGIDLLDAVQHEGVAQHVPFVVFIEHELSSQQRTRLDVIAQHLVVRVARSLPSVLDESVLFLHRRADRLDESKREMLRSFHVSDEVFSGKKILVVDDDTRNIFALSSVLERHGMQVMTASNGRNAIGLIERSPGLALVLLDIMMPEMDGYQTLHQIRSRAGFQRLPVIALTAKAMKGDREKCLAAGASDYIAKPVDTKQLLALLRVWLHR